MNELKKCPFCGGEAKTSRVFGRAGVVCMECDANIRMYLDASMEEAIQAWNTRKPVEDVVEALEEERTYEDVSNDEMSCGAFNAYTNAIKIVKEHLT